MRLLAFSLALALCVFACARESVPPTAPVIAARDFEGAQSFSASGATIGLRRSPIADQYFWLRVKVLEGEAPAAFSAAFAAMRDLRAELGSDPGAWEDLEIALGDAGKAADLLVVYAALPEQKKIDERTVALRDKAVLLAKAMRDSEGAFVAGPYRDHVEDIMRAGRELTKLFSAREAEVVSAMTADLGLSGGARPLTVTLVEDAPYPGAFAADDEGHAATAFLRVRRLSGADLVEALLMEVVHALDELTVRSPSAMNKLRAALAQNGIDESDSNAEMVIQAVMFAESASLVRRFVDPAHHALAEKGFYVAYPPGAAVATAWEKYVAGETLEKTVEAIVHAVSAP